MKRSTPGFILTESSLKPVYANTEAIRILAYPQNPSQIGSIDNFLTEKMQSVLMAHLDPSGPAFVTEFSSGKRRYVCRAFALNSNGADVFPAAGIAILIERKGRGSFDGSEIAGRFQLTAREREVLEFLMQGLTNKEIGKRMNISPNTVKAFLRLIMVKMGASTRAGIIGKILDTQFRNTGDFFD